jgi:hypothetical protein
MTEIIEYTFFERKDEELAGKELAGEELARKKLLIEIGSDGIIKSISTDGVVPYYNNKFVPFDLFNKLGIASCSYMPSFIFEIEEYVRFYNAHDMETYKNSTHPLVFSKMFFKNVDVDIFESMFREIKWYNKEEGNCHKCSSFHPLVAFLEPMKSTDSFFSRCRPWSRLVDTKVGFCKGCFSNWARSKISEVNQYQERSDFWAHTCSTNSNVREHYEPGVGLTDAEFDGCPMCFTWQNERLQIFNNSYNADLVDKEFRNVGSRVKNGTPVIDAIKLELEERQLLANTEDV